MHRYLLSASRVFVWSLFLLSLAAMEIVLFRFSQDLLRLQVQSLILRLAHSEAEVEFAPADM